MAELASTNKVRKSRFAKDWKARFVAGAGAAEDGEFKLEDRQAGERISIVADSRANGPRDTKSG